MPVKIPSFEKVAQVDTDPGASISWDHTGKHLLVSGKSLRIILLPRGEVHAVSASAQSAGLTAWSPLGDRIAVTTFQADETHVRILSVSSGETLDSQTVPGRVSGVFWPSGDEILVASAVLKVYSFGAGFRFLLHRFHPGGEMSTTVLSDATVKPGTANYLGSRYERVFHVDLSPYRDEIIYTRFHDPPEAYPYLRLMSYHLSTGNTRVIDELPLSAVGAVYAGNGEEVYYDAGRRGIVRKDAWSQQAAEPFAGTDATGSLNASGSYLLVGNSLFREDRLLSNLPVGAVYSLSGDGRFLAARQDSLLQVFALPAAVDPLPRLDEAAMDKLFWLRSWRSQGLISPAEYQKRKQRMIKP